MESVLRKRVVLSLCMIVRDAADTLRTALDSICPWVDELVVVDTGSTDSTVSIATDHGAAVYSFPWCDDFSAARNESLAHAQGDWVFWMDADDVISAENGRRLKALAALSSGTTPMAYVVQVHCPGFKTNGQLDATIVDHVKMFRNLL